MSHVKDFFQNVGSFLTFGLIPPAMPDMPEFKVEIPKFEMPEMPKIPEMPKFTMPEMPKIPEIPTGDPSKYFLNGTTPPPDPSVMPVYPSSTNPVNPFK